MGAPDPILADRELGGLREELVVDRDGLEFLVPLTATVFDAPLIIGAKSGGKGAGGDQHVPTEDPDSLRSKQFARVIDAISEGEIEGLFDQANPLKSVYLDDTPIQNADGTMNFSGVTLTTRNGTQSQSYLPGFPASENEVAVVVDVKSATPIVRTITSSSVDAARITLGFPTLESVDINTGDRHGTSVQIAIDLQSNGGGYVQQKLDTITGKCTTTYQRAYRIELTGSGPWDIRARKITADSTQDTLANTVSWSSYTELVDSKFRYPNTALAGLQIDSSQFRTIPRRGYDCKLLRVKVPVNYDPPTRVYTGSWNGTFKVAWTDNPAWCFYDLITNALYGLGEFITEAQVDKFALYSIGQYCDELVDDGFGGQEPRFTCNLYLQTAAEAYTVINNMASVFRGIIYWTAGALVIAGDSPADPTYQFNQTNVIGGTFNYSGSSGKQRHTVALVGWNDPADAYRQKVEYVPDEAAIARYGVRSTSFSAIGSTSRGQAHRAGKWLLATEQLETETVTFQTGMEGMKAFPGAIVQVHDAHRATIRFGGRVSSATAGAITVDLAPSGAIGTNPKLSCMLADGTLQERNVSTVAGNVITPTTPYSSAPQAQSVWILKSDDLAPTLWRVIAIEEAGPDKYSVTALSHDPNKFAAIDSGIILASPPTIYIPPQERLAAPTGITWTPVTITTPKGLETRLELAWVPPAGQVSGYIVDWRFELGQWYRSTQFTGTTYQIPSSPGTYNVRVFAIGPTGQQSAAATDSHTVVNTSPIGGSRVTGLELFGQDLDTNFYGVDAVFAWRYNAPATSFELGSEPQGADSGSMGPTFKDFEIRVYDAVTGELVRVPEHTTDPHWTYTYGENLHDGHGTPRYTFTIGVRARDTYNTPSEEATLTVTNPAPDPPTDISVFAGQGLLNVVLTDADLPDPPADARDIVVYASTSSGFTPSDVYTIGAGPSITIPGLAPGVPYYLRFASRDAFRVGPIGPTEYTGTPAAGAQTAQDLLDAITTAIGGTPTANAISFPPGAFVIEAAGTQTPAFAVVDLGGGQTGILLSGDILLDASRISVANLESGALPSDVQMSVGDIVIDGNGSITIPAGPGANQDLLLLTAGDLFFKTYIQGIGYVTLKTVNQQKVGVAGDGDVVDIPGYWKQQPLVNVMPNVIRLYDPGFSGATQTLRCQAVNLRETAPGSEQWRFDAQVRLEVGSATGQTSVAQGSGDINVASWTSPTFTTLANAIDATVHIKVRSKRGNGASQYFRRQYRWRIDTKVHTSPTFVNGTFTAFKDMGDNIDVDVLDTMLATFGSANQWDMRAVIEWQDKNGTVFGGITYQFSTELLSDGSLRSINVVSGAGGSQNNSGSFGGFSSSSVNPTWEIYQIDYAYTYSFLFNSGLANGAGLRYGNMSTNLSVRGTLKDSAAYVNLTSTTLPNKTAAGSFSYVGSGLAHIANPWSAVLHADAAGQAQNSTSASTSIAAGATANIKRRTPVANSTTQINNGFVDVFDYHLAGAQVVAPGTMTWFASGRG
jgi:hypothetical protein